MASKKAKAKSKAPAKPAKKAPAKAAKPAQTQKISASGKNGKPSAPSAAKDSGKGKAAAGKKGAEKAPISAPMVSASVRRPDGWMGPLPDKALPRATKLSPEVEPLTKREMEQVLTVGTRGVVGEGSLKGKLVVYQGFPYLEVIGRDKRELWFLLQGPDQEVLPAYVDHKVSIGGLIRRNHNYGGMVDVRKYSAKKPEQEVVPETTPAVEAEKLRLLSPGEIETLCSPGMSVGLRGFATLRGRLEQSGEEFYLVVSNPGTRQQVGFTIQGKNNRGLKKYVGEIVVSNGVVEKSTAWGGTIESENCEPRAPDFPPVSREAIEVTTVEAQGAGKSCEVKLNHGLVVKLTEKQGYVWSIEPQTAKRVSLREVDLRHNGGGAPVREFFFTPRNPGGHEVEFFLAKVHNPMQVSKTFKLQVNVKQPAEITP